MRCKLLIAGILVSPLAVGQASACIMHYPMDSQLVRSADVVVIGKIVNYEVVPDPRPRADRERRLADPKTSDWEREFWQRHKDKNHGFLTDYSRFDIVVERFVRGGAPATVSVKWDNSTFDQPNQLKSRSYFVALREPWAGDSTSAYSVLQEPCSSPFLLAEDEWPVPNLIQILESPDIVERSPLEDFIANLRIESPDILQPSPIEDSQ